MPTLSFSEKRVIGSIQIQRNRGTVPFPDENKIRPRFLDPEPDKNGSYPDLEGNDFSNGYAFLVLRRGSNTALPTVKW